MAEEKSQRPRDAHGRFLPKDEIEQDEGPSADAADASASSGEGSSSDEQRSSGTHTETIDISDTVAPSIGPHSTFTRTIHDDADEHQPSDVDAMGLDKRREVMGQRYSPSLAKQATLYGIFLVVLAALVIGGKMLADELDQPPDTVEDQAVWSQPDAPQRPPEPLQ